MPDLKDVIKLTYRDYVLLPEDKRYELIEGEFYMVPSPQEPHQRVSSRFEYELVTFVEDHDLGYVYHAPFDVVLSMENVVQPDIIFVAKHRRGIITQANIQGSPDLLVEILSPSTSDRDLTLKRNLYGKYGVREYWIVDTEAETVEVSTLGRSGLETYHVFPKGNLLVSPLLPGLQINLDEIFAPLK